MARNDRREPRRASGTGHWQNLRTYGASDEVSSWSNHENRQAVLGWDSIEQGKAPYLYLSAHAHASGMGGWNDKASSVFP
jgi:hypothetical protein